MRRMFSVLARCQYAVVAVWLLENTHFKELRSREIYAFLGFFN